MDIPHKTRKDLETKVLSLGFNLGEGSLLRRAFDQAETSLRGRDRYSNQPVLTQHIWPVTTSGIDHHLATGQEITQEFIAALSLHDVPDDDKSLDSQTFRNMFGDIVYNIVNPLIDRNYTHDKKGRQIIDKTTLLGRQEFFTAKLDALQSEHIRPESRIIFLADRDNNLRCMYTEPYLKGDKPTTTMKVNIMEAVQGVLPFAAQFSPYYNSRIKGTLAEYQRKYPSLFRG